jgi:hypothetical protein
MRSYVSLFYAIILMHNITFGMTEGELCLKSREIHKKECIKAYICLQEKSVCDTTTSCCYQNKSCCIDSTGCCKNPQICCGDISHGCTTNELSCIQYNKTRSGISVTNVKNINNDIYVNWIIQKTEQDKSFVNARYWSNATTALHFAASKGNVHACEKLLQLGADVNAKSLHKTALHIAITKEVVKILLNWKAKIEIQDDNGFTPLLYHVTKNHIDIVRCLLNHGANIQRIDLKGWNVLHHAGHNNVAPELVSLLLRRGAMSSQFATYTKILPIELMNKDNVKSFEKYGYVIFDIMVNEIFLLKSDKMIKQLKTIFDVKKSSQYAEIFRKIINICCFNTSNLKKREYKKQMVKTIGTGEIIFRYPSYELLCDVFTTRSIKTLLEFAAQFTENLR